MLQDRDRSFYEVGKEKSKWNQKLILKHFLKTLDSYLFFAHHWDIKGEDAELTLNADVMFRLKRKSLRKRSPAPFKYKNYRTEISGRDDNKWLLILCTLDKLKWYLLVVLLILGAAPWNWLLRLLSG